MGNLLGSKRLSQKLREGDLHLGPPHSSCASAACRSAGCSKHNAPVTALPLSHQSMPFAGVTNIETNIETFRRSSCVSSSSRQTKTRSETSVTVQDVFGFRSTEANWTPTWRLVSSGLAWHIQPNCDDPNLIRRRQEVLMTLWGCVPPIIEQSSLIAVFLLNKANNPGERLKPEIMAEIDFQTMRIRLTLVIAHRMTNER